MLYVLNEWVFHDLLGDNTDDEFQETGRFLIAFTRSNDGLVIPVEKRWNDKSYQLMRMTDPRRRQISQLFHSLLRDSRRAVRPTPEEPPTVSQELREQTPPEDLYLVLAYSAAQAELLVTTDEKLHAVLAQHDEVNCQLRGDFLASYGK